MNDALHAAFIIDRFSARPPTVAVLFPDGSVRSCSLRVLSELEVPLVVHDAPLIVDAFRSAEIQLPKTLVDLSEALKLRSGVSKDQGGQRFWNVWRMGAHFFEDATDVKLLEGLFNASVPPPDSDGLWRLASVAAVVVKRLWEETVTALQELGEWERFLTKEIPVQQVFHERQRAGLRLDEDLLMTFVKVAENEKFTFFRKLSAQLGFSPMGLSGTKIAQKLFEKGTDLPDDSTESIEDWLELARDSSASAANLLGYLKASRDVSVLRQLRTKSGRAFPTFHTHGTVTSRVLVSDPRLQQLRRRFRGVVISDEGKSLAYFDYAQFEPGILAHLCGDAALIDAYRSVDLYKALARQVFGADEFRDKAKRVFLAYCYGMSKERIATLLAGKEARREVMDTYQVSVTEFFARYPGIETFRSRCQAQLLSEGRISTAFGNFRQRTSTGLLTYKEQRWAMNHVVQGTASLIFKNAVNRLAGEFTKDAILLPMHDAVLMQFPEGAVEQVRASVTAHMIDAFQTYCPSVLPKVVLEPFSP